MKKTLLCFLFLLPTLIFAQISKLETCQNYPLFDLTTKSAELIGNLNPLQTNISYHLSLEDANNNVNAIPDPVRYSSYNPRTIYARINNNGTISTNYFELGFYPSFEVQYLTTAITCDQPKSQIMIVGPGGNTTYYYSLDYGETYKPTNFFYLDPGNYTVLIRDSKNCAPLNNPLHIQVGSYTPLIANATVTEGVSCGDKDLVTITGTGGASFYTYSFDGKNYSASNVSSELKAGTHTVYIKDQVGCIASTNVTVNQYKSTLSSMAAITNTTCNNKGSIKIVTEGGKLPYQYSINGAPYITNQTSNFTLNNLEPGAYSITTKDDANCTFTQNILIRQYNPISVDLTAKNVSCKSAADGSIEANATGGVFPYKFQLRNAIGTQLTDPQSSNIFKYLGVGDYTVDVIDAVNCSIRSSIIHISEPNPIIVSANIENQTITVNAVGGTGKYLYSLDLFERVTNNVFTNVSFGNHEIYVFDENGCYTMLYITVNPPAPIIDGKTEIVLEFKSGQTLGDLVINGQNIKWYSTPGTSSTGKTSKVAIEPSLPLSTVLVDGVTYYASQTINGIESKERLAVTAKLNGSLSNPDFDLTSFQFYPNPVKHILSVKNKSAIEDIQIFSVSGQSAFAKKLNSTEAQIDLSHLASGLYILNIKSDGKEKAVKFIKE
ncbi:T9SS type A sorting domain-containing protein [Flavobacterium tyrosinilyticum]|uniref:T9SS type A sorting domain-containing protein n=1 Tax=Flavobacterium tyrosinilyticum TaxID=1658740 RepID=UPI0020309168|nr:T9SS type A sorting domain-containing protein [Flavobacterium tyrosinilyticum]MCM0665200.1 T9SS type A sorting domain-containing protein [Flavobacterium tyrosinilyticum]